ncbi:hypothetical protein GOP47_0007624 [Adiantum capillus-veneris]|nr:hypothetical protein GOP47_0007624 [Adiantum capillus-veneris]
MATTIFSKSSLLLQSGDYSTTPSLASASSRRWRGVTRIMAEASSSSSTAAGTPINPSIKKQEAKVVDTVLISDLRKPLQAYCRCWRSKTFPLCDGTHAKHNKETGDNVGPLLLKK